MSCFIIITIIIAIIVIDKENHELSDEEVLEIYNDAVKVFYWFQVGTMNSSFADSVVVDNQTYFKIEDEVGSYQELVDFMGMVLDDKLVDQLLNTKVYIEHNGMLYGLFGDRGTDQFKGKETFEIVREDKLNIICRINVEVLDADGKVIDNEVHDFHLKYFDDHKWRFESFYLFK